MSRVDLSTSFIVRSSTVAPPFGQASSAPLTVVLIHWNQAEACLRTVQRFTEGPVDTTVIVVDNGSRPDQLAVLRDGIAGRGDVALIEQGHNSGFGPGANAGLRRWLADGAGSTWAVIAPHDAEPATDCLEVLGDVLAAEPMAGLACADVGDGEVPWIDPYFGGITRPSTVTSGWEDADYPHGTLMALRRECVAEIGLFDERFFAYCEEADLGLRARAAGWGVGLVHGARVTNTHLGSSVAAVDYLQQRNTLILVREMSGRYHVGIRIVLSLIQILSGVVRPAGAPLVFHPRARLLGIRDFLRGRTGPPPAELFAVA